MDQCAVKYLEPTNSAVVTRDASGIAVKALTYLDDWGISTTNFDTADGKLIIKTAVIQNLLAQTIVLTGAMYILDSTSTNGVRINGSGVLVGNATQYVDITSSGIAIKGGGQENKLTSSGMEILIGGVSKVLITSSTMSVANGFQVNGGGSAIYFEVLSSAIDLKRLAKVHEGFEHVAGGVTIATGSKSDWRTALGLKGAAILDVGTGSGDVAAGNHNHSGVYAAASHTHSYDDISCSGKFKSPGYQTEAIALSGITTAGWVPAYDCSGNYIGKIPVFA
jgi:hypothetical protein